MGPGLRGISGGGGGGAGPVMFEALNERFIPGGRPSSSSSAFVNETGSSRLLWPAKRPDFCFEDDFPLAVDLNDPCDLKRLPNSARPKMGSLKAVPSLATKAREAIR